MFKNLYDVKNKYFPNFELDELEGKKKFKWNTEELNNKMKNMKNLWKPKKDIFQNTIIVCQHCHQDSGYTEEGFRYYVISCDIKCRNCGEVIIEYNNGITC